MNAGRDSARRFSFVFSTKSWPQAVQRISSTRFCSLPLLRANILQADPLIDVVKFGIDL